MRKIILNTPCMPKGCYHVGNAMSQIITDVLATFYRITDPQQPVLYVNHAWNVHGLPFERLYAEAMGRVGSYREIQLFAQKHIESAIQEKAYFANYRSPKNHFTYIDTDPLCIEFCVQCFHLLAQQGYIQEYQGECYLDLEKFFARERENWLASVQTMHISPEYQRAAMLANQHTLGGLFPLTKQQRLFVPTLTYQKISYALNPIFQSLVYPCYLAERFGTTLPTFLQASAAGHGMLKWHYLRTILAYILTGTLPYAHLILHGTLLGDDGTPMSKYKHNSICPSDLYQRRADPSFVRYVLLKSLSSQDIPLQLEAAEHEYAKIVQKGSLLRSGSFQLQNEQEITPLLTRAFHLLRTHQIKLAFEHFYLALKKARIGSASIKQSDHPLAQLYDIFLRVERDAR